ncbi:MAG: DUF4349 domain-containing protein [Dehalococcoidales bacterium]|nr:DUF4349 domain-containing protein [Dehalococcoidales bacterium]
MKRLTKIGIAVLTLFTLVLVSASCGRATVESPSMGSGTTPPVPGAPPAASGGLVVGDYKGSGSLPSTSSTDVERMIVRTGEMSLVVTGVVKVRDDIAQLSVTLGGYVVSSQIWGQDQDMRGSISIRVPDEKFDSTLSELRSMAVRVTSESTNSQDITEEYVDLTARLKNAEATESQYLDLLQQAKDVEDILKIYERLSQVRSEIEQIKGRMQYLEHTSSMSLISVSLTPVTSGKPLVGSGWTLLETLKAALRGIVTFGQWLLTVIIWLVIFSPLWGSVIGILYWRRRKKKAKA